MYWMPELSVDSSAEQMVALQSGWLPEQMAAGHLVGQAFEVLRQLAEWIAETLTPPYPSLGFG